MRANARKHKQYSRRLSNLSPNRRALVELGSQSLNIGHAFLSAESLVHRSAYSLDVPPVSYLCGNSPHERRSETRTVPLAPPWRYNPALAVLSTPPPVCIAPDISPASRRTFPLGYLRRLHPTFSPIKPVFCESREIEEGGISEKSENRKR